MTPSWLTRAPRAGLIACAALLSACSTIANTTDAINPFNDADDAEITEDDRRISILALEQTLEASPELQSSTLTLPTPTTLDAWPNEGGSAAHSGGHPLVGPTLSIAWKRSVGEGSSRRSRVNAPPVVGGGRLFAIDGTGRVSALDMTSGSRVWSQRLRSGSRRDREARAGGVAYSDDMVFVASGYGFMAALDAASGEEIWRTATSGPMHSAPTVSDGRVFAVSFDSELYALDAASGDVLWTYQSLSEPARILSSSSPAVAGDTVIAPFASGEIAALRVENGRQVWTETLTRTGPMTALAELNDIAGSPVVADGFVYAVSHSGSLGAFDLRTGQRVWAAAAGGIHMPWVAGDAVFVVTSDAQVAAISRVDGRAYWVRQLDRFDNAEKRKGRVSWAGPVLAGGRLVLASSKGNFIELDPGTGETVNGLRLGDPVYVAPIVAGDTVYVMSDDARLIALR